MIMAMMELLMAMLTMATPANMAMANDNDYTSIQLGTLHTAQ